MKEKTVKPTPPFGDLLWLVTYKSGETQRHYFQDNDAATAFLRSKRRCILSMQLIGERLGVPR